MWHIHDALHAGDVALITGARGDALAHVTGMGGIGKSLLAEEYALRFGAAYPGGVFWLRALGHDDAGEPLSPDEPRGRARPPAARVRVRPRHGCDRPAARAAGGRADAGARRARAAVSLDRRRLPRRRVARAIAKAGSRPAATARRSLTTRSRAYAAFGTQVDLGVLGEDEGVELLARHRTPDGDEERAAARGLVERPRRPRARARRRGRGAAGGGGRALVRAVPRSAREPERRRARALDALRGRAAARATRRASRARCRAASPNSTGPAVTSCASPRCSPSSRSRPPWSSTSSHAPTISTRTLRSDERSTRCTVPVVLSLADAVDGGARQVHTLVSRTMRLIDGDGERSRALGAAAVAALTAELCAAHRHASPPPARRWRTPAGLRARHRTRAGDAADRRSRMHDWYRGDHRAARPLEEQALEARGGCWGRSIRTR